MVEYLPYMKEHSILCAICKSPTKIVGKYIRMVCPCDEDCRTIHLDDIKNSEHRGRLYLLETKTNICVPPMTG